MKSNKILTLSSIIFGAIAIVLAIVSSINGGHSVTSVGKVATVGMALGVIIAIIAFCVVALIQLIFAFKNKNGGIFIACGFLSLLAAVSWFIIPLLFFIFYAALLICGLIAILKKR